ncbi:MAG TPA: HPr family phosphocarrier protein [Parachlamydiaceae bacterium]|nr:HPr family phosphocarrier protein [Parachlamydiaceae bacterium]
MYRNLKKSSQGSFTILNDRGLHCRPSTEIVKCAASFKSDIFLNHRKNRVNAKSLFGILTLAAPKGSKIKIEATGVDAEEAVAALIDLASESFKISY